jgi:hypothetical protein
VLKSNPLATFFGWLSGLFGSRLRVGSAAGVPPFPKGTGPTRLVIIRHAEKTGEKSNPHLSRAGKRRAERLASYIPATFGRPDFLVAAAPSQRSYRPTETIEPLAGSLGLPILDAFDDEDSIAFVKELRSNSAFAGKFGIISWRHSNIPVLVAELGARRGSFPAKWGEDCFNLTIEMEFRNGESPSVRQIVQPF